jgi:hypothetical protein
MKIPLEDDAALDLELTSTSPATTSLEEIDK